MNFKTYLTYIGEYKNIGSAEQLLGQIGFPPDMTLTAEELVKAVDIIAAAANNSIKTLVDISGLSMKAFERKYLIPYRTIQDWCSGEREPAAYLSMLIGWQMISEMKIK